MAKSFDDWMDEQFPGDLPAEPDLSSAVCELCERYAMPPEGAALLLKDLVKLWTAMGRVHRFARRCETEEIVRDGFRVELFATVLQHLKDNLEV